MHKLVIDDLDIPEKFTTVQEAKSYANEFFGTLLVWKDVRGYQIAKFEDDIIIQIKPIN